MEQPKSAVVRDKHQTAAEVARDVFAAIDAHDLETMARYYHADVIEEFVPIGFFRGRTEVLGVFGELFQAIPDLRQRVEQVLANDQMACVRWHLTGTFTGAPFQGIQPTGSRIDLRGTDAFMEVQGGLIRRNTVFYDGAAFGRDIGLLPARGSRSERILTSGFNLRTRVRAAIHRIKVRPVT